MPTPPFAPLTFHDIETELKEELPDLFDSGLVASEVRKAFGHQTFLIQATGGRNYLLKVARQPAEVVRLEAVANSVALARNAGLRTPAVVRVSEAVSRFGGRPYLVQEYWPGRDAEDFWPNLNAEAREAILRDWGVETARMHAIGAETFSEGSVPAGQEADWSAHVLNRLSRLLHYNQRAQVLTESELKRAQQKVEPLLDLCATQVTPVLTHRDLCLKNVLVSTAGVYAALLDFEHARFSDPVMDFVKLRLWLFEREPAAERAFLAGYRSLRSQPWALEDERYEIALLLELLGEIPYYKRNAAQAELDQTVARLRARL